MNRLDTYYRALILYRKEVDAKREIVRENNAVAHADTKNDKIFFERKSCKIDRSWVDEIEKGLVFVEKAIKEERQFIRSNGEVVPIEKVKNVSKSSVEHLARHSNLITRVHEGEDLIPDHLYTVEKLNDYAVYENRFLYMLLCYLRDFISLRYNKILDISNTYDGVMTMNKVVRTEKQTTKYKVELEQTIRDDEYLKANNKAQVLIDRIDLLLKTVVAFLSTPLMEIVAKAPMLKPPITKTNVLKMNNNFKGAMELYGFVTSYEGDGYTVETEVRELSPFEDSVAEQMANTVSLSAFITYTHALGIEGELKKSYREEEERRKQEELERQREKLEEIRIRLKHGTVSVEEFILALEERLKALEKKAAELTKTQNKLRDTERVLAETRTELAEALEREGELRAELDRTLAELEAQKKKYEEDMANLRLEYEGMIESLHEDYKNQIEEINTRHEEELESVRLECEEKINEITSECEEKIETLTGEYEGKISSLTEDYEAKLSKEREEREAELASVRSEYDEKLEALESENKRLSAELDSRTRAHKEELDKQKSEARAIVEQLQGLVKVGERENAKVLDEKRVAEAKLLALKAQIHAVAPEDTFVTEERFDELERTFEAFKRFYREEWTRAKKRIRKDYLKTKKNPPDYYNNVGVAAQRTAQQAPAAQRTVQQAPAAQSAAQQAPAVQPTAQQAPAAQRTVQQAPAVQPTAGQAPAAQPTAQQVTTAGNDSDT